MNIEKFLSNYSCDSDFTSVSFDGNTTVDHIELVANVGGASFNSGMYRVINGNQISKISKLILSVFPEYKEKIVPFAYDWLGRVFVINIVSEEPLLLLMEPGAGEVMQIPVNLEDFHNVELVEYKEDALALNFFLEWRDTENIVLTEEKCIGYKVPLFLNGDDEISNLEIINLEVYLDLCGQLRSHTINLPEGKTISEIEISE